MDNIATTQLGALLKYIILVLKMCAVGYFEQWREIYGVLTSRLQKISSRDISL